VYLSGLAYVLVSALRRIGLKGTEMARAQAVMGHDLSPLSSHDVFR
jgi:hypothetical protein